jgi:hypothetical protein
MIFAELQYEQDYSAMHFELVDYLKSFFPNIQHGLQGDSWIWIFEGDEKVAIDSFSSMKHQVKSDTPESDLIEQVIATLSERYKLARYDDPELEPHEDI